MGNNPFFPGYYDERELKEMGFGALGQDVQIAKNCTIVGLENITIDNHVRIDGYTTILALGKGFLNIGSYIHIGASCFLSAGDGITMNDYSGLSQGVRIYTRTDDYSGNSLTNPTIPSQWTSPQSGPVVLRKHVIVGSGSVILPNATLGEGVAVGALSLVKADLAPWGIYAGCPAKWRRERAKTLLELEAKLHNTS